MSDDEMVIRRPPSWARARGTIYIYIYIYLYGYGHAVWEVGGSNPTRGIIVEGIFHPSRQLARFSPPNICHIL